MPRSTGRSRAFNRTGDALRAATAIAYGIERIASTDPAFDGISGLTRLDPMTA